MKRLILPLLMVLAVLALLGCSNSEFPVDGEFTAYALSDSGSKPQVATVTVTIDKGKISKYYIDVRQGFRTATVDDQETPDTTDDVTTYSFGWNAQTKRELGYEYKMHYSLYANSLDVHESATLEGYITWLDASEKHEWFEQAVLLEDFWLAHGVELTEIDDQGEILNVAGVTISNSNYVELALEAIELAKQGKFQAIVCTGTDLYSASMIISSKGEISDLILDVMQANKSTTEGTFTWKEQTKQELGYNYRMLYNSYLATLDNPESATQEGYLAWLSETNHLEWFEQAKVITDYVIQHGWTGDLQPVDGEGMSLDGVTIIDGTSGVTISTSTYFLVLSHLFGSVGEDELD